MCGICGFVVDNSVGYKSADGTVDKDLKTLLSKLLVESKIRGTDATGVVAVNRELRVTMLKKAQAADMFIKDSKYDEFCEKALDDKTRIVFGHTRQQTKGSFENNLNNHPIHSGNIIGVHNGMINNDEVLWRSQGFPKDRRGLVDSEVIFHLLDLQTKKNGSKMTEAIYEVSKHLTGSYACAAVFLDKPKYLWLFCKSNPIYIYCVESVGLKIFASAEGFIRSALASIGINMVKENLSKVPSGAGRAIDAGSGKILELALHTNVACGYGY